MNGLILVNGLPGSGKTTLARELAAAPELPLSSKDAYKERLWDRALWVRQSGPLGLAPVLEVITDYPVEVPPLRRQLENLVVHRR